MASKIECPPGAIRYTSCSLQIEGFSSSLFERDTDKKKRAHNGRMRLLVLSKLASKADADGGSCYPSAKTIALSLSMSERQVKRYLKQLEEQGWIANGGYQWERGPRARLLVLPADIAIKLGLQPGNRVTTGVTDTGVTDTLQEGQIGNSGGTDSGHRSDRKKKQEGHPDVTLPASPTRKRFGGGAR